MSGGSQHNPNGRQSQLGPGWSPLQLQMANLLARAPQAHMASDRGVTWHTPTPPPHLYHVPAPSPPDPLQAMKNVSTNSVFRHTTTPPELYRHTPTPPDKHLLRHTPSPGDVKVGTPLPSVELYPHLGPARDKMTRAEELLAYARVGVDLSLSGARAANGAPGGGGSGGGGGGGGALSVRDAPTINSLIARSVPRHGAHARVDSLLERLVPSPAALATPAAPASPHSVIVHSRAAPTPSPPSSNEDSADSCSAPPGSKRKRKPERTLRVPLLPPVSELARDIPLPPVPLARVSPLPPVLVPAVTAPAAPAAVVAAAPSPTPPLENGDAIHITQNGPDNKPPSPQSLDRPHARRKTRSGSAETIDDIAAMIASTDAPGTPRPPPLESIVPPETDAAVTVDNLKSVLASPETEKQAESETTPVTLTLSEEKEQPVPPATSVEGVAVTAAAPRRRSARLSNSEAANVPVESPSEAKPAESESGEAPGPEPTAASFVEVENQLEKMFAGLEEEKPSAASDAGGAPGPTSALTIAKKRRKSAPARSDRRRVRGDDNQKRKIQRKKSEAIRTRKLKEIPVKDAYDSGSNASSGRSRGPYIQIRGPRDSPVSVSVMNASTGGGGGGGGEEEDAGARRKGEEFRNGARTVRAARGLHASTLGLRYDATTPDLTWLCAFCQRGPHADALGDLFGPYDLDIDCDEYRSMEESLRRRYVSESSSGVWFHEGCAVWAPGLVAAGARLWGLASAVWSARGNRCSWCQRAGAALACAARGCPRRLHLPCAAPAAWRLDEREFRALCPRHA